MFFFLLIYVLLFCGYLLGRRTRCRLSFNLKQCATFQKIWLLVVVINIYFLNQRCEKFKFYQSIFNEFLSNLKNSISYLTMLLTITVNPDCILLFSSSIFPCELVCFWKSELLCFTKKIKTINEYLFFKKYGECWKMGKCYGFCYICIFLLLLNGRS